MLTTTPKCESYFQIPTRYCHHVAWASAADIVLFADVAVVAVVSSLVRILPFACLTLLTVSVVSLSFLESNPLGKSCLKDCFFICFVWMFEFNLESFVCGWVVVSLFCFIFVG